MKTRYSALLFALSVLAVALVLGLFGGTPERQAEAMKIAVLLLALKGLVTAVWEYFE